MSLPRIVFGLLTWLLAACTEPVLVDGEPPVGIQRIGYTDPDRTAWSSDAPRPLSTFVWYPAPEGTETTLIRIPQDNPVFTAGLGAWNAPMRGDGPLPLILMSHGTGGSALQMMWLARALASEGYVVAAVDHHGNSAAETEFDPRGFLLPRERALDITAVLDQLLEDPELGPSIDRKRIGAVGFSLGGFTVALLAGAQGDVDRFRRFCDGPMRDRTCDPQTEFPEAVELFRELLASDTRTQRLFGQFAEPARDPRISTIALLAPALAQAVSDDSLGTMEPPILVIGASGDDIAPVSTNAERLALAPHARIQVIDEATHYDFLNLCTRRGKRFVPVCKGGSVPREDVHRQAIRFLSGHFAATLATGEVVSPQH